MPSRSLTVAGAVVVSALWLAGCSQSVPSSAPVQVAGITVTRPPAEPSGPAAFDAGPEADAPPTSAAADPAPEAPVPPTTVEVERAQVATPTTLVAPSSEAQIGALALARLDYPLAARLPRVRIVFLPQRPGLRGLTYPDDTHIEIYVRPDDTPETLARVLAHEIGHAIDLVFNTDADRARWRAARGLAPSVPWWPDPSADDAHTGAGDFAEAVAVWLAGSTTISRVGGPLTSAQLELVARLAQG